MPPEPVINPPADRGSATVSVDVVIPTVGRPSLHELLDSLASEVSDRVPGRIVVVDDRRTGGPLALDPPGPIASRLHVVRSGGRGPAAARNRGWQYASADWIAFLDDDVVVTPGWLAAIQADLADLPVEVAGSQGCIEVPLPRDRRPTDRERNVAGLERARWATADMAYRRRVLQAVGGFDERFPRAYREDAEVALRIRRAGYRLVEGRRRVLHPVRPVPWSISLRTQAGNADDALMLALHGRRWRDSADVPAGDRRRHLLTVGAALVAAGSAGRHRRLAAAAGAVWASATASLAWRRIAPGPRTPAEVVRMGTTSVVLPFLAALHWTRGLVSAPVKLRRPACSPLPPQAVLFDRDGTLIHDVPYNGDPERVVPMGGAARALERLRSHGIPTAVVSNQSAIGRGLLTRAQVDAVNARVEELLGPLGPVEICPHSDEDGCDCRKPATALLERACQRLQVDPRRCVVIGDTGADIAAAEAVGATAILVPTPVTRREEIEQAPYVVPDVTNAVELALRLGVG